jgi:hypothetical protein
LNARAVGAGCKCLVQKIDWRRSLRCCSFVISYTAENALGARSPANSRTTSISRLGSQAMFATKQEVS